MIDVSNAFVLEFPVVEQVLCRQFSVQEAEHRPNQKSEERKIVYLRPMTFSLDKSLWLSPLLFLLSWWSWSCSGYTFAVGVQSRGAAFESVT